MLCFTPSSSGVPLPLRVLLGVQYHGKAMRGVLQELRLVGGGPRVTRTTASCLTSPRFAHYPPHGWPRQPALCV